MFLGRRQPGPYAFVIGMCSRGQRSSSSRTPLASSATGSSSTWATPERASGRLPAFASRRYSPESVPRLSGSMGRLAGGGCRSRQRSTVG